MIRKGKPVYRWTMEHGCPFCNNKTKARIKVNGNFYCSHCKAVFFGEENDEVEKRSTFTGIHKPYDPRDYINKKDKKES